MTIFELFEVGSCGSSNPYISNVQESDAQNIQQPAAAIASSDSDLIHSPTTTSSINLKRSLRRIRSENLVNLQTKKNLILISKLNSTAQNTNINFSNLEIEEVLKKYGNVPPNQGSPLLAALNANDLRAALIFLRLGSEASTESWTKIMRIDRSEQNEQLLYQLINQALKNKARPSKNDLINLFLKSNGEDKWLSLCTLAVKAGGDIKELMSPMGDRQINRAFTVKEALWAIENGITTSRWGNNNVGGKILIGSWLDEWIERANSDPEALMVCTLILSKYTTKEERDLNFSVCTPRSIQSAEWFIRNGADLGSMKRIVPIALMNLDWNYAEFIMKNGGKIYDDDRNFSNSVFMWLSDYLIKTSTTRTSEWIDETSHRMINFLIDNGCDVNRKFTTHIIRQQTEVTILDYVVGYSLYSYNNTLDDNQKKMRESIIHNLIERGARLSK